MASKERRSVSGQLSVVAASTDRWRPAQLISPPPTAATVWLLPHRPLTLECLVATGQPPPLTGWTVDGHPLPARDGPEGGDWLAGPGYVTVRAGGRYACANGSVSGGGALTETEVRRAVAPSVVQAPQSQVFPIAKTVRFECHVAGLPTPNVKWLKVNQSILIHLIELIIFKSMS